MRIPRNAISLMARIYFGVIPQVNKELKKWKSFAEQIPNEELRKQALKSIEDKTFHCEGGSILALLALNKRTECIRFIVAYQTISDYLDNLCDRSTSLDPLDFTSLHQSIKHALMKGTDPYDYYQYRKDQDDGGYLASLVVTCQECLLKLKNYDQIQDTLLRLANLYCDLQVHKHVEVDKREALLTKWFEENVSDLTGMHWYEFSACAGSTLGIFCLVAYATQGDLSSKQIASIVDGYFPFIQGLHILLDYFIDQEEDRLGGDLNFCTYYESEQYMIERFIHFIREANEKIKGLPHETFHRMIYQGLVGIYLSDKKVQQQAGMERLARKLIKEAGFTAKFFYNNGKLYRYVKSAVNRKIHILNQEQFSISGQEVH